ncbi:MAG: outer membrane protein assembly factor BamD [Acidobacteriia bacterium]|nr:outer membrane protein assembly factor BamD [Terriglobia bacterium]
MRLYSLGLLTLAAMPVVTQAASREIQELQRDVGLLQEQVKALQTSQDEKLAALTAMVQQAIDNANKANTGVAVIQSGFSQSTRELENKVVTPVVTLGTRMDQMSGDFRGLQNAVSDLTSIVNKLQAQLTDINNAIKVLQAPPAPPPSQASGGVSGTPGAALGGPGAASAGIADTPTMSASDLYAAALRDRTSGNLDLALQEFNQYLKWYGNTDLAANAQFYVGYIHYSQADYDDAVKEFDLVLEKYPSDNNKIPDALYYKGMSLTRLGHRTQGSEEFKKLVKDYPNSDYSRQACSQLTAMGLRCATAAAAPKGVRRKG